MKIIVVIENTPGSEGCLYEHGLSLYIETENHKIMMDSGASDAFIQNARLLGVDLEAVDTFVLSHGHYDHAGGIIPFSEINGKAPIYMQKKAGCDYYHEYEDELTYIGIDKRILKLPQVVLLDGEFVIDDELSIYGNITGNKYKPTSNAGLVCMSDGETKPDTFDHEQCLVVKADEKTVLVSGCAHNGILNILDRYRELYGEEPDIVISGFHMMKKTEYTPFEAEVIENTAYELLKWKKTTFYTGHCTGAAFEIMKKIMGDSLIAIHSGDELMSTK